MYSHDNEYLSKLKEHERHLDWLQEQHEGYTEEPEYDPEDDIDDDDFEGDLTNRRRPF
jgi:hypothetical protein